VKNYLIIAMLIAGLVGCSDGDQPEAKKPQDKASAELTLPADAEKATLLLFQEKEKGVPAYGSRVLVTPDFLRMDDGNDQGDFLLYDRKTRTIYSVANDDQTILEIGYHPVTIEPPYALELVKKTETDESAPTIGGSKAVHTTFSVNSHRCYDVVSVSGLLNDATAALGEYATALAGEQARNLYKTPVEFQDPCMLSNLIFHTADHFADGFPIQEWSYSGYSRELMDYQLDYPSKKALFVLPENYKHYQLKARENPAPAADKNVGAPSSKG
jgi:hypothetical protein